MYYTHSMKLDKFKYNANLNAYKYIKIIYVTSLPFSATTGHCVITLLEIFSESSHRDNELMCPTQSALTL